MNNDDIVINIKLEDHENLQKLFSCHDCGRSFRTKGNMKKHIEEVHVKIKYPCGECSYQASQKTALRKHMLVKHAGHLMKCKYCDKQYKWDIDLKRVRNSSN